MKKPTDAMRKALQWLSDRNGAGVLDSRGRIVAGGEVSSSFAPETWLRLVALDAIRGVGGGRLVVTGLGDDILNDLV